MMITGDFPFSSMKISMSWCLSSGNFTHDLGIPLGSPQFRSMIFQSSGSQKLALGAVATGATGLTIHHNTKVDGGSLWICLGLFFQVQYGLVMFIGDGVLRNNMETWVNMGKNCIF